MKAANRWLLFAAFLVSLIHGPASLQAQPARDAVEAPTPSANEPAPTADMPIIADEPVAADEPEKPWNRGVPMESRVAARKLLLEGNRLMQTLLFARAAEKYVAALSKWKHPRFYFNLAAAQIGLGQEVEARENLELALAYGAEPLGEQEFKDAQRKLQDVKRQLGRIRVTCQTPGAEVTLDGMTLFIGPGSHEAWVKARAHELTAKRAGYLSEARRVTVSAGQLQDVELKLVTLSQATDASRRWAAWKPWAVVAAGGAIAAGAGGLHALAARNFTRYDDQFGALDCAKGNPPPGCPPGEPGLADLNARLKLARREQAFAVGGYIVGGSLIATGVVLLYMNRPRMAEQGSPMSSAPNVAVVPEVTGDMFGVRVSVSH